MIALSSAVKTVVNQSLGKRTSSAVLAALLLLPVLGVASSAGASAQPAHVHAAASLAFVGQDQPDIKDSPKGEPKEDAPMEDQFRHSKTVEWFSHVFHTDIETTARIFEYINFAVIALAVGIPLFRTLPKVFRKRSAKLSADIDVAQAKTADANERLGVVEAKLKGLDAEIAAIRSQVDEAIKADEVRAKALIEEETARIVASAEQEIAQAGNQAQRSLRQFAADLAIDRALTKISLDAETDSALIAEFASDIASGSSTRGSRARKGEKN